MTISFCFRDYSYLIRYRGFLASSRLTSNGMSSKEMHWSNLLRFSADFPIFLKYRRDPASTRSRILVDDAGNLLDDRIKNSPYNMDSLLNLLRVFDNCTSPKIQFFFAKTRDAQVAGLSFKDNAAISNPVEGDSNLNSRTGVGRTFLVRAEHDSDIIDFITEFAMKNDIITATFTAIGALKTAKLGFYDQGKHVYSEIMVAAPQEIACCVGNISLKEGKAFVHAHTVVADENGDTKGGHLLGGKVFAAEIHITEVVGARLVRKHDAVTGLALWQG